MFLPIINLFIISLGVGFIQPKEFYQIHNKKMGIYVDAINNKLFKQTKQHSSINVLV